MKTTAVSTGLSDFHKMTVTVMKTTFPKSEPKIVRYRDFSKYKKREVWGRSKSETKMPTTSKLWGI